MLLGEEAVAHRTCHALLYKLIEILAPENPVTKHSKHTWIVDVIEDNSASIEVDGRTVTPIPQWILPEGVKEGDVLSVTHDRGEGKSTLFIEADPEAKRKALGRSEKQVARKSQNDRGGDISL